MVHVPCYPGDYQRMNNENMFYSQNMHQFLSDQFNCAPYLPPHALAQRPYNPTNHNNIPPHNYVHEPQYMPPCTPMSQLPFYNEQPVSPQDISAFQTPPQKICYYADSNDGYTPNLPNYLNSYVQTSQFTSESTESEEMSKEGVKNLMSKQIIAILEQQGPTANGKRKRIKRGTLTESQKVYLRRERNRVAATKYREKRRQQSSVNKLKYEEYDEKNLEIRMDIERLERQKVYLLSVIESHSCIKTPHIT
ncbi:hypothetical protein LOD99_4703 [Oopsacas minuta]|uniref:BZIP domain-containing protein n=1 Tax=Oopsacas minuta TaxID=111878 RepID=A0AAV7JSH5_9METZ|nr:hypothetical protein LOD99_4703 [Oopsacas minuta]